MVLEVKIGIRSVVKKIANPSSDGNTHNYKVVVQGLNGNNIEHFVQQVVFYLPYNSSNSEHVKTKPPYCISGSTSASFRLLIDVFLHTSESNNKVRYSCFVQLPNKPFEDSMQVQKLRFRTSPSDFREKLLRGGAEVGNESTTDTAPTLVQVKSEPIDMTENESADNQNEIHDKLTNTCAQSKDSSEKNDSFQIQGIYSYEELMRENELLRKENEELNNKFIQQEGSIAGYVEQIPALQKEYLIVKKELDELTKKSENLEAELSTLKSSIQIVMAELIKRNNMAKAQGQMKRQKKSAVSAWGK